MFDTRIVNLPKNKMHGLVVNSAHLGALEIAFNGMRFLITHQPSEAQLDHFIQLLRRKKVTDAVRVCDPTYDAGLLKMYNINVVDWPMFEDGSVPPQKIVNEWLALLRMRFTASPDSCIAVHCVAGLGRAPVLVAIALMELGMRATEVVDMIRTKRRGAINKKQQEFLENYRPKARLRLGTAKEAVCSIQ